MLAGLTRRLVRFLASISNELFKHQAYGRAYQNQRARVDTLAPRVPEFLQVCMELRATNLDPAFRFRNVVFETHQCSPPTVFGNARLRDILRMAKYRAAAAAMLTAAAIASAAIALRPA